jgi:3-oxoacyl-[acyl-carrier protein] reductase
MTGQFEQELAGKSALVTGSTAGVGKAIATRLGDLGASVVVNGRTAEKGNDIVETIKKAGGKALFHKADITDYEEVTELVNVAVDAFDDIDILVGSGAASAAPPPDFFEETAAEDLLAWCKYGYLSRVYPIKAALEYLKGGGRIVLITADAGKVATPAETGPGAAAAALNMATRVLAAELARYRITVNTVSLSVMRNTPAERELMPSGDAANVFEQAFDQQSFDVTPADVAELVTYLVGNHHANPITGQIVSVNGGVSFPG